MTAVGPKTRLVGKKTGPVGAANGRSWPADAVERRLVASLVPSARNARTHSPQQVAQLVASIREWGWTVPVLIDEGRNIIAGHGRVLAAQQLGLADIPVVVARGWSEAQKRAYLLADNQLALNAGWDVNLLRVELGELRDLGADLALTGFGELEIESLLRGSVLETDPDVAPDPPQAPVTQPGDLWVCGDHRALCGDATVPDDIRKVLAGDPAGMCFTDPPYGVNYAADARQRGKHRPILNDRPGDSFEAMLRAASVNILTATNGAIYICMSSAELDTLQHAFREAGGHWSTFVIWAKHTFTLGRADYQRQYEPILYGWREGAEHLWCGSRDQGDVWFFDKPSRNELHPTMKPVALVERAILNSSRADDVVLDPFGGSGTTMIAAHRASRRARLVELDPAYVDVSVQRWRTCTGNEARLEGTGQTFDEVAATRRTSVLTEAVAAEGAAP